MKSIFLTLGKQLILLGTTCAAFLGGLVMVGHAADQPSDAVEAPGAKAAPPQPATAMPSNSRPEVIYVTDFHLDPSHIEQSQGPLGGKRQGPLGGRLAQRKSREPEDKSQQLVRALSDSIVKHLNSEGFHAVFLPNVVATYLPEQAGGRVQFTQGGASLPKKGWLVTGWFEQVREGNAAVEATVGFGQGSGSATADVVASDLARDPAQPFLVMGSGSRAKKMPGGLVTKNPYVMGAKFVINKRQGMEKDVSSLGVDIAKNLIQYIQAGTQAAPGKKAGQ